MMYYARVSSVSKKMGHDWHDLTQRWCSLSSEPDLQLQLKSSSVLHVSRPETNAFFDRPANGSRRTVTRTRLVRLGAGRIIVLPKLGQIAHHRRDTPVFGAPEVINRVGRRLVASDEATLRLGVLKAGSKPLQRIKHSQVRIVVLWVCEHIKRTATSGICKTETWTTEHLPMDL